MSWLTDAGVTVRLEVLLEDAVIVQRRVTGHDLDLVADVLDAADLDAIAAALAMVCGDDPVTVVEDRAMEAMQRDPHLDELLDLGAGPVG